MWGHKQRTYYNFSEIIQGCGISKTGLDNCILNGTLAVHAWIPPISVFKIEESLVHNQVVLKRTEMHWEGYIRFWGVGEATAKRDLSDLARLGLIRFVGTRRSGYYEIH